MPYVDYMALDTLNRRSRTAQPAPRVRRIVLTDADYLIFEAINRHGPLPSTYLYEMTKHIRRDRTHLQNRLTEFYNGDERGAYLTRPPQQFASYHARYQPLVYDLAPRARGVLAERGVHRIVRADPFVHRLMAACALSSIELAARVTGLRFISFEEILARPGCAAARAKNPLALPTTSTSQPYLVPDQVFGIEYPGAGFRFFAVEIDRNTESIERRDVRQAAFSRKVTAYRAILRDQSHHAWWGVPNLHVLTISTSRTHVRHLITHVCDHCEPALLTHFAFTVADGFGPDWRTPATLLPLLDHQWDTPIGKRDIANARYAM